MFKRTMLAVLVLGLSLFGTGLGDPARAETQGFDPNTAGDGPWTGLPDLDRNSAKFLSISGEANFAIADPTRLVLRLSYPSDVPVRLGVFDGDTKGLWDQRDDLPPVAPERGIVTPYDSRFRLFADPNGDLAQILKDGLEPPSASPVMDKTALDPNDGIQGTDNAWCELYNVPSGTDSDALNADVDRYEYTLVVDLTDGPMALTGFELNGFKIAFNGDYLITGGSVIGFIGGAVDIRTVRNGLAVTEDPLPGQVIDENTESFNEYDGVFEFGFDAATICDEFMIEEADADWQLPPNQGGDLMNPTGIPPDDGGLFVINAGTPDARFIDNSAFVIPGPPFWEIVDPMGATVFSSTTSTTIGHTSTNAGNAPAAGGGFQSTTLPDGPFRMTPGAWTWRWSFVDSRNSIWIRATGDLGTAPRPTTGVVFCDDDRDGVLDQGEATLANVTLTIESVPTVGPPIMVTTDAMGRWTTSLTPGTYRLTAVSGAPGDTVLPLPIEFDSCSGLDVGIACEGMIMGRVYCDNDEDGTFLAPPDEALAGLDVTITPLAGGAPIVVQTDANGLYLADVTIIGAGPEDFEVAVVGPVGATALSLNPQTVSLSPGDSATVDFRFLCQETLNGRVYCDVGDDGSFTTPPDIPLSGVTVRVTPTNPAGAVITTTTAADGTYSVDLLAGAYDITIDLPAGSSFLSPQTLMRTVVIGTPIPDADFRLDCGQTLRGRVYCDADQNGAFNMPPDSILLTQTGGVPVTVTPTNPAGAPIMTQSGPDGTYSVDLQPGEYEVSVPAVFGFGTLLSPSPVTVTVVANTPIDPVDFRYLCEEPLQGVVYCDVDRSASLGVPPDEPLAGVTVTATLRGGGMPPVVLTTDANGEFSTMLGGGTWDVTVTPPPGATPLNATTQEWVIDFDDALFPPLEFRFLCQETLRGKVYCDNDESGDLTVPPDELLAGVGVSITPLQPVAPPFVVTTNAQGEYAADLSPGTYSIAVVPPTGSSVLSTNPVPLTVTFGTPIDPIDFRLRCPARLSGFVILEQRPNCDGVFDPASEFGLDGVEVVLEELDAQGLPTGMTSTTMTNAAGFYEFMDVAPGLYRVFVANGEVTLFAPTPGTDTTLGPIDVAPFSNTTNLDFFYCPGQVRVVVVRKPEGAQNCLNVVAPGDTRLGGVTVGIVGTNPVRPPALAITDALGVVVFDNLPAGEYRIDVGPGQVALVGLDPSAPEAVEATFDLPAGDVVELPSAWCPTCTIMGRVLYDPDCIPFWNARIGQPGIPGVTVQLRDASTGAVVAMRVTDAAGLYAFEDLSVMPYVVEVLPGPGLTGLTATTDNPVLVQECPAEVNFLYGTAGLEAIVRLDLDCDGAPDGVLDQVPVTLRNLATNETFMTATDAQGRALFPTGVTPGLVAGVYRVSVPPVPGLLAQTPLQQDVMLVVCQPAHVEFRFCGTGSITGCVIDERVLCDGTRQPGEPGIPGVTVTLVGPNGAPTTTTTGPDGCYAFTGLARGTYQVSINGNDPVLVGLDPSTPTVVPTTVIPPGESVVDFYLCAPARIRGTVFREGPEPDCNGILEPGEPGIGGVVVCFTPADGNVAAFCVETDALGRYDSGPIDPGMWTVEVAGQQPQLVDLSPSTATSVGPFELPPGATRVEDFGYCPQALSGTVFREPAENCNGILDAGDTGIAGVTVTLVPIQPAGAALTTTTDANGFYRFVDIPAGLYEVFVPGGQPQLVNLTPSSPETLSPTVLPRTEVRDQNFGYCPELRRICGTVFLEPKENCDGVLDPDDSRLEGIIVTLEPLAPAGPIQTTTTDANGDYCFRDLVPGVYQVTVDENMPALVNFDPSTPTLQIVEAVEVDVEDVDFGFCDECPRTPCCEGDIHEAVVETHFYVGLAPPTLDVCASLHETCDPASKEVDFACARVEGNLEQAVTGLNEVVTIERIVRQDGWVIVRLRLTAGGCAFPRGFFGNVERLVKVTVNTGYRVLCNTGCARFRCEVMRPGSVFTWTPLCGLPPCEDDPIGPAPTKLQTVSTTTTQTSTVGVPPICDCGNPGCEALFRVVDVWSWEDWTICFPPPACPEQSETCECGYNLVELEFDYWCLIQARHEFEVAVKAGGVVIDTLFARLSTGTTTPVQQGFGGVVTLLSFEQLEPGHYRVRLRLQKCDREDGQPSVLPYQLEVCTFFSGVPKNVTLDLRRSAPCLELGVQEDTRLTRWSILRWISVEDAAWCEPPECDPCPTGDCDEPCGECDGKVTELTLQYLGTQTANVEVIAKEGSVFNGQVAPGQMFSFSGNDKDGTLGTEIKIFVNGREDTAIHTSCSRPIGPGLVSGSFEVVTGRSLKGGRLCGTDEICECKGGVTALTLQYQGSQAADVRVEDGKGTAFSGFLVPGETFSFTGNDKEGKMGSEIELFVNGRSDTKIHTSCSRPIGGGLVSGSFQVIDGQSKDGGRLCDLCPNGDCDGGPCGECKGGVTALTLQFMGNQAADVRIEDKKGLNFSGFVVPGEVISITGNDKDGKFGGDVVIYVNGNEHVKIHTSCSQPVGPGTVFGAFEVISGRSKDGGEICPETNTGGSCECDGKVTTLTLRYLGSQVADVDVDAKEGIVFSGLIAPGQIFSFTGNDKEGTLGTETEIFVNGRSHVAIHTSCSRPIAIGMVFGDFEIVDGASLKGGRLCEVSGTR